MIRPDLHSHTLYSDGELTPSALMTRAADRGVTHLAITDHDCLGAYHEAIAEGVPPALTLLPGAEISTRWQNGRTVREIHIVALLVDPEDVPLQTLLHRQQALRRERAADIAAQLSARGIDGVMPYLDTLPCQSVGRNHIASFLIDRGLASNKQDAFKRYLGSQGKLDTPAPWCGMEEAISVIHAAGGIAVLAHPDRYRLSRRQMGKLLEAFVDDGGAALEVSYSNLNPDVLTHLAERAVALDLWASVGSDFHTPDTTWMDLGRVRQLPANCESRAIWHHPRWRAFAPGLKSDAPA